LNKHLDLTFNSGVGTGEASPLVNFNGTDSGGITVFGVPNNELTNNDFNWLAVNESINGSIRYVLGDAAYSSFELVCRSTSQQKPLFTVNLTNGGKYN